MKESNILADNAAKITLIREILHYTKGEYMRKYKVLLYTIGLFIKANTY